MNKGFLALITVLGICFGQSAVCAPAKEEGCDPCGKPTAWDDFNALEVKVSSPGARGYAAWRIQFDKESVDMQVDAETNDGEKSKRGRILLFGGLVMATQGPVTEPGYEIDALDAPILERHLVTQLLGRSLPDGPSTVKGTREIDFTDEKTGIQFATPSAQGFIPAPWRVKGDVKTVATDVVEFKLVLTVKGKAASPGDVVMNDGTFTGRLSKVASARIDDTMSLDGWNIFGLGVQIRKEGSSTAMDYGAAPATSGYKTVADIRKKIAAETFPGEPDLSKNFTGFWKTNCDDPFGLQIMPFGADGKYSVVFCGPGGCGKAGEDGRNTFINKDPHYGVVSEAEIKIRNADGSWDAYTRCTKDTHPILKYKDQAPK